MSRAVAVVAAAVVAILSGTGLYLYVARADERAASGEQLVPVLVADQPIGAGTPFEEAMQADLIVADEVPQRLVPPSAVGDPNDLVGQVARDQIPVGLVVVSEMFADEAATGPPTLARKIPDGRVAVTFSAGPQAAVADLIQPGDQVNLIIKTETGEGAPGALPGVPEGQPAVLHVFQNLEVFAIGQVPVDANANEPQQNPGGGLYTVLVDPKDATRLIFLTTEYDVYLALAPPGYEARSLPAITGDNALPDGLTPEESAGR